MKILLTCLLTTLLIFNHSKKEETSGFSNDVILNIGLEVDSRSYEALHQQAGERGITPAEFGQWLAENGTASINTGSDGEQLPQVIKAGITIMAIDERGAIVSSESLSMEISERPMTLSQSVGTRQLGSALDSMFPGDAMFPGDSMFPGDAMFPGDTFFQVTLFMALIVKHSVQLWMEPTATSISPVVVDRPLLLY